MSHSPTPFAASLGRDGVGSRLEVRGRLDAASTLAFEDVALMAADSDPELTIDLRSAELDPRGLLAVVRTLQRLRARGARLSLRAPERLARRLVPALGDDPARRRTGR